ncbi:MAG TPA: spermidine synthase [Sulfurospirillum sp. UBA12182]|nr:MAG TPA: spermidine synthase [Sulfurospirillum sp. UBA12182]
MNHVDNKIITAQMLLHVPLCSHKEPKNVLVLTDNRAFQAEFDRYEEIEFFVVEKDYQKIIEGIREKEYDVVILDAKEKFNPLLVAQINRVLKEDGLAVALVKDVKSATADFGALFDIVMPYRFITLDGFGEAVFASKKFHPTADLILQRSDLLEGVEYYNTEIHLASFALPNFMRKELQGIYKQ